MADTLLDNFGVVIGREESHLGLSPSLKELFDLDYERMPVSVIEFVESTEYFGRYTHDLSPVWKDTLVEVFTPNSTISTLILTGPIGNGKTTVASIAMGYTLYQLLCLRDPAKFYGLLPGSRIVLGCFNITLRKSEVGYDMLKAWIDDSPYFKKHSPRRKRPDEPMYFPSKNIRYDIGSLAEHALGESIFAFMLDEANFFKKAPDPTEKSRAHKLFNSARVRLVQRFQKHGRVPGIMILLSSKKKETSFLEEQLELVRTNAEYAKTVKVAAPTLWDVKPEKYSGKKFRVAIGDHVTPSRILEDDEVVVGHKIAKIPVELKMQFEEDIELALMDLAGIATIGSFTFFRNRPAIYKCIDRTRSHPFDVPELLDVTMDVKGSGPKEGSRIIDHFDLKRMCQISMSRWVPRVDPSAPRAAHVDLGITHDSMGIAIGHVSFNEKGQYIVYIDIMLRVRAKPGQEIDLEQSVQFFLDLRSYGYRFEIISYDWTESRMAIQQLLKHRMNAGRLSIKLEHYEILRRLQVSDRILYYQYEPFLEECIDLREGETGKRPNHPDGGSDDVCDGVAGVVCHCSAIEKTKKQEVNMPGDRGGVPLISMGSGSVRI